MRQLFRFSLARSGDGNLWMNRASGVPRGERAWVLWSSWSCLVLAFAMALPAQGLAASPAAKVSTTVPQVLEGELSLAQAWQMALQHDELTVGARRQVERAESRYRELDARFFPDITLRAGTNRSDVDADSDLGDLNQTDVDERTDFAQVQVVLPWGAKRGLAKDAEIARVDVEVAKANYQNALRDLYLRLAEAYYGVVLHEEKLEAARKSLSTVQARLHYVQEGYKLGGRSNIDLLSEEANLLSNRSEVELAAFNLREKQRELFALLHVSPASRPQLTDRLRFERYVPPSLNMPEILAEHTAAERLRVNRQDLELEKAGQRWFPRIGLHAGYRWFEQDRGRGDRNNHGPYYGAFIEVPWPTPGTSHARQVARIDLESAQFELKQATDRKRNRILELLRQARLVEARVDLLEQLLQARRREVEVHRASYELGKITALDMNLVESSVVSTEQQYYEALFDYAMVVTELKTLADLRAMAAIAAGAGETG